MILNLTLAGGLDCEQVLPWLRAMQRKIAIPEAVAAKLQQQHEHIPVEESAYLQPVLLREAVLLAVR